MENKVSKVTAKKNEEQTSNKVLTVFASGALLLWCLSYLFKVLDNPMTFDKGILISQIVFSVSAILMIGSAIWLFTARAKGKFDSSKVFNPLFFVCSFAVIALCCGLLWYDYLFSMKLIYILIPAIVIFHLIYNIYQRAFFGLALSHGVIAFLLYYMSNSVNNITVYVMGCMCVAVCAIAVFIAFKALNSKGALNIGKLSVTVFESNSLPSKKTVLTVYGVTALAALVCMFIPAYLIMYAFYAIAAFIVSCAIYFTIRLM